MDHALVSIIIPIYNVSEYLDACVQSACDQTYRNLEIILVDNGSPDNCPQKCDEWAQRDSRIRVIHKKNGGLSDARNTGLDAAAGKYIYFLDTENTMNPNLVETLLPYMKNGIDMAAFQFESVSPDAAAETAGGWDFGIYKLDNNQTKQLFLLKRLLPRAIGWEVCGKFFRRDIIEKHNLRFSDFGYSLCEDLCFCLCYSAHINRACCICRTLCIARRSVFSTCSAAMMTELAKAVLQHFKDYNGCKQLLRIFPAVYYMLLKDTMDCLIWGTDSSIPDRRRQFMGMVGDFSFYRMHMRLLPLYWGQLSWNFSGNIVAERIAYACYFANGREALFQRFCRHLYSHWAQLEQRSHGNKELDFCYRKLRKYRKRIFLLATEEFGNIGDNQINESVVSFLQQVLPEYLVHEVTAREWHDHKQYLINCICPDDLIVFPGGGNFGDTYLIAPALRAEIIRLWPDNPKIVFPQTIYFSDTEQGRAMLEDAKQLYTRENHVTLYTRERPSYEFAQKHFSCDSYLVPDIVLSSNVPQGTNREGRILLCMRQDIEKKVTQEMMAQIIEICEKTGLELSQADLQIDYYVNREDRKEIIEEKLDLWRSSKLVITDRLHGMVFAAITGTPCIALSNFNHKVRGTYEWVSYLPYIRYAESIDEVSRHLPELLEMEACHFDGTALKPHFDQISNILRNHQT